MRLRLTTSTGVPGAARARRRRGRAARRGRRRGRDPARAGLPERKYDFGEILLAARHARRRRRGDPAGRDRDADPVDRRTSAAPAWASRTSRPCRSCTSTSPAPPPRRTRSPAARPLRTATGDPVATLGAPTGTLLNPAAFAPPKLGNASQDIAAHPGRHAPRSASTASFGTHDVPGDYTNVPHLGSTRYARIGDAAAADRHERDRRPPSVPPARLLDPAGLPDAGRRTRRTRGPTASSATTSTSRRATR